MTTPAIEQLNVAPPASAKSRESSAIAPDKGSLRVCAVSLKPCWQEPSGRWMSSGGFPLQMRAIGSLFGEMTLVVVRGERLAGGIALPEHAHVVPLRKPAGADTRRKLSVLCRLPYYLSKIAKHVWRADVVHVPVPGDIPLLGILVAVVLRKRLLVRYCGSWQPTKSVTFMNRVTRTWMRLLARGRNVTLATGEETQSPAPGMDWVFATALSRSEIERTHPVLERGLVAPPRLVYAGRLSPEKGVQCLIEAVSVLKESGFRPLPFVTILGDGPERTALESQARALGCEPCFEFAGQVDRNELSARLSQADLCVQPSLTEGFSKAWLDAMAHGLPVLTTTVGAASAVIGNDGERGWLVPPGDVGELARKLEQVLTEPVDWPALRGRCREYVEQRTLEAWAERIGELSAKKWNMSLREGKLQR